jgi:hypothetical protein
LLCSSLSLFSSSSLYSIFSYGHLVSKCPSLPQVKHLKGSLPLYVSYPLFIFLTNCVSSIYNSWIEMSYNLCPFVLFYALKFASFYVGFYFYILISYVVKIPCSSSIVSFSRSFISSMEETLELNIKGRNLITFCKIIFSSTFSPSPLMVLTISPTQRK